MTSKSLEGKVRGGSGAILIPLDDNETVRFQVNETVGCERRGKGMSIAMGAAVNPLPDWRRERERGIRVTTADCFKTDMARIWPKAGQNVSFKANVEL